MSLPNSLKLYFDGSCMPKNPGGVARYGWSITNWEGKRLISDSGEVCRGPEATCNLAEWNALAHALRYLEEQNWTGKLEIMGDSQLVIRQITGAYKVSKDTLIPLFRECKELLEGINWTAKWIPRKQNQECDRLSRDVKDKA
jgi:ribonuclease HI